MTEKQMIDLDAYVASCHGLRFQYGYFDCGLFAAECIRAMAGYDCAACLRWRYDSRREMLRAIRKLTGSASILALVEFMARKRGWARVDEPRPGDLVVLRGRNLGIVSLDGGAVWAPKEIGVARIDMQQAMITRIYRVVK
jgi:hypothetical protein